MKILHGVIITILVLAMILDLQSIYEAMGILILLYVLIRIVVRMLGLFGPVLILLFILRMFH